MGDWLDMIDSARRIGHLDMDAFFAAVEQLDDPTLRGRPVIVGGLGPRGVVATASYEARVFGIHSAMPSAVARRRCPEGVFLRPRFSRYREISDRVRAILRDASPVVETISLDEAFFDLTAYADAPGGPVGAARAIKERVQEATSLTCSVGVAPNRFLAKLGSELDKPDGFLAIEPESVRSLLDPLPVGRVWGVGRVTEKRLSGLGLLRVRDLRLAPADLLTREFGSSGARLQALSRGEDDTPLCGEVASRSISRELTYTFDLVDPAEIEAEVRDLARSVALRLQEESLLCRIVRVKVRYPSFQTITRQLRLAVGADSTGLIERLAVHLLRTRVELNEFGVRLIGVGVGQLSASSARQLSLFD